MRLPRPALPDMIFALWAVLIAIVFSERVVNGDGDPARHIRLGQMMIDDRALVRTDTFSWPAAGSDFLAFEWGSEVTFAAAYNLGGLPAVGALAGGVLALSYALLCRFLLRQNVEPALAYGATTAATIMTAPHWLARPHIFTFLGVALLLPLLEANRWRHVWLAAPLFVIWANFHGGFVFGLAVIGAYAAGDLIDRSDTAMPTIAMLGLGAAATVVNPYGLGLHRHIGSFFGLQTVLDVTDEFQRPDFTSWTGIVMLVGIAVVIGAFVAARRRPRAAHVLMIAMLLVFAMQAQRNLALFGFVALPLAALHYSPALADRPVRSIRASFRRDHERGRTGPWAVAATALLALIAATGGQPVGLSIVSQEFDGATFPVAAVSSAQQADLEGRLFNSLMWGGYLLLEWPEQRVYIDGGTDHYGDGHVAELVSVLGQEPGWQQTMSDREIDLVLLPPQVAMLRSLVTDEGWTLWHCDAVAAIAVRPGHDGPAPPVAPSARPAICPVAAHSIDGPPDTLASAAND